VLWKLALRCTTSSHYMFPKPLGPFLREPHLLEQWRILSDKNLLSRQLLDGDTPRWAIYERLQNPHYNLRSGARFSWKCSSDFSPPFMNYASVQTVSKNTVALHSLAQPPAVTQRSYDFWTVLRAFGNQSL